MSKKDLGTLIEHYYLEHTVGRSAFYHVKVYEKSGSQYDVYVTFGNLVQGRTVHKGTFNNRHWAATEALDLKIAKERRDYREAVPKGPAALIAKTLLDNTNRKKVKKPAKKKPVPANLARFSAILD